MRWKNVEVDSQPKNLWLPNKPANCLPLYFTPKVAGAIADAQGVVFIVEGEKDVLTMLAAHIPNTLTWLDGGLNIPKDIAGILAHLAVNTVIHIPDLDEVGRNSAKELANRLKSFGITYKALELPAELGQKGDVNDLWKVCHFEAIRFQTVLKHLPIMEIEIASAWESPVRPKSHHLEGSQTGKVTQDFLLAIERALGVRGFRDNGWSIKFRCPFHNDKNPSANWNRDVQCFKCFGTCSCTLHAKEVGAKLGISL